MAFPLAQSILIHAASAFNLFLMLSFFLNSEIDSACDINLDHPHEEFYFSADFTLSSHWSLNSWSPKADSILEFSFQNENKFSGIRVVLRRWSYRFFGETDFYHLSIFKWVDFHGEVELTESSSTIEIGVLNVTQVLIFVDYCLIWAFNVTQLGIKLLGLA